MSTLFLVCAAVGGTVLACQFVLTLVGTGGRQAELGPDAERDGNHLRSNWFFGVLSFRTIVAAITFFGLAGLMAESAGVAAALQLVLGTVAGLAAMYGVHWIIIALMRLGSGGKMRVSQAVGKIGTVRVPIPGGNQSAGEIQIRLQGRLAEYPAQTSEKAKIATGTSVIVVGLANESTLQVEHAGAAENAGAVKEATVKPTSDEHDTDEHDTDEHDTDEHSQVAPTQES